jgi:phytoene dehydrogenase-like protein
VNLALDALPDFKSMPGPGAHLRGAISISPTVDYMERAYDDAKYGRFPRRPYIDMVIPSLTDPSVAPPGKHVMSCFVQYAPYKLAEGNWDEQKEKFGDTVIDTIAEHAPNLRDIIIGRQVVTPLDLEREFGLTEGNIFQGELSLEQLFFLRPVPGWARYRTPVRNLYMCGSATHPGGGIMGAPGRIAALEMLKDWGRGRVRGRARSSSSAAGTTGSPPRRCWPGAASRSPSWSAARSWAAPPPPRSSIPATGSRPAPTRWARCAPRWWRRWTWATAG